MSWATRSATNLLPLSLEKRSLNRALREWTYTGDMYDLEEPIELCELCDHPDIRYQFKIVNALNANELLVGSECINRFGILALGDEGETLNRSESRRKVSRDRRYLVNEARKKKLINTLVELSRHEENFDITSFIGYVQDREAFTPNQLGLLFWRLDHFQIKYNPTDFKIIISRGREKNQLLLMEEWKAKEI